MSIDIGEIAARLRLLEDKEDIRQLKARYLRACDMKQPDVIRDCFLPDEVLIAFEGFPRFTHRDAFVATYEAMACKAGVYDLHHATNWDISLTGPDMAKGLWSLNFRTILLGPRHITRLSVEYEDVYQRRDGRWWIVQSISRVISAITENIDEDGAIRMLAFGAPGGSS